jgi:hypothetical protein
MNPTTRKSPDRALYATSQLSTFSRNPDSVLIAAIKASNFARTFSTPAAIALAAGAVVDGAQDSSRARELLGSVSGGDGQKYVTLFDNGQLPPTADELTGSYVDQALAKTNQNSLDGALAFFLAPLGIEALADTGIVEELAGLVEAAGEAVAVNQLNNAIEEAIKEK